MESIKRHCMRIFISPSCANLMWKTRNPLVQGRRIADLRGTRGEVACTIRKQAYIYSLGKTEESEKMYQSHRQLDYLMRSRCPGEFAFSFDLKIMMKGGTSLDIITIVKIQQSSIMNRERQCRCRIFGFWVRSQWEIIWWFFLIMASYEFKAIVIEKRNQE